MASNPGPGNIDPHKPGGAQWGSLHAQARRIAGGSHFPLNKAGNPRVLRYVGLAVLGIAGTWAMFSTRVYAHPYDGLVDTIRPKAAERYRELLSRQLMGTPTAVQQRGSVLPTPEEAFGEDQVPVRRPHGGPPGTLPPTTMK